jgi:hypothetical protein
MMRRLWLVPMAILPLACSASPTSQAVDAAVLAPGALGPSAASATDADLQALAIADTAFADSARTYGQPAAAARAAAAVEYLAGALNTQPRWAGLDGQVKADMLAARAAVRASIGVASDAPSQSVLDALVAAGSALADDDTPAAERALRGPAFTLPPDQVLQRLQDLPYLRSANVATHEAAAAIGS